LNGTVGLAHQGAGNAHPCVRIEPRGEHVDDVSIDDAVGIQKKEVFAVSRASPSIHACREAGVGVDRNQSNPRESLTQAFSGLRHRRMIDENDLDVTSKERVQRIEAGGKLRVRAVVDDED
jgi:hypothetical protein